MLSVRCLSCLSVCDVGVLWPNGWIKMKLGTEVGLGPSHTVLGGDPALLSPKGHSPQIFSPYLLWPNGWMDQDAIWYGGRHRPRPHCVRREPSSPPKKRAAPPISGPCLLWPNGRPSQPLLSTCKQKRSKCWMVANTPPSRRRICRRNFLCRKSTRNIRLSESHTQKQHCTETAYYVILANECADCSSFLLTYPFNDFIFINCDSIVIHY